MMGAGLEQHAVEDVANSGQAAVLRMNHAQRQACPLSPDSLMWRHFGDRHILLFLFQGLSVQLAHPVIGQGVKDHSTFRSDPWGRLERSLALLWPVVYNTPEKSLQYGARLREMHRSIKGTLPDGRRYQAFDPEAYLLVHMTVFDAVLRIAAFKGEPLDRAGEAQLFGEWLQMGQLLVIRKADMPDSIEAFRLRFDDIIRNRLERTELLDYMLREEYFATVAKPPLDWLPDAVWTRVSPSVGKFMWFFSRASFPPAFREKFDVPWSDADERNFQRLRRALNLLWKVLPERQRYLPDAASEMRNARLHPEQYRIA